MKNLIYLLLLLVYNLSNGQSLKVADYYYIGELHNKALDYLLLRVDENKEFSNVDESVIYINSLINDFMVQEELSQNEIIGYDNSKYFLLNDEFHEYFNNNSSCYNNVSNKAKLEISNINNLYQIESGKGAFVSLIANNKLNSVIDEYEKNVLIQLSNLYEDNWAGRLNTVDLIEKLSQIEKDFNLKNYHNDDANGHTVAIILAVSIKSMEWWSRNFPELNTRYIKNNKGPSLFIEDTFVLPNVVAQDIAGAIVGGIGGAIWSSINGGFSWSTVGWGAFYTGLMASTGMVGRIAKVIKKI